MLVGALVGILSIVGWGALALGVLAGIFGQSPNLIWLIMGLCVFVSGLSYLVLQIPSDFLAWQ
jgi:hypothetical protein